MSKIQNLENYKTLKLYKQSIIKKRKQYIDNINFTQTTDAVKITLENEKHKIYNAN